MILYIQIHWLPVLSLAAEQQNIFGYWLGWSLFSYVTKYFNWVTEWMEEIIKPSERATSACQRKSDMVFVLGYENEKVACVLESQDDSECGCAGVFICGRWRWKQFAVVRFSCRLVSSLLLWSREPRLQKSPASGHFKSACQPPHLTLPHTHVTHLIFLSFLHCLETYYLLYA